MNTKNLKFCIFSAVFIFLLYMSNLFIFRVILVALLALTIGQSNFFQNIKEQYKEIYTIAIGLTALILAVVTFYTEVSMIYGITGIMLFHPDVTWALIPIFLLLAFTNLVELPLFSYASKLLRKRYMKLTFVILLLLFSFISIAWEANYRTMRDDNEFYSYVRNSIDSLSDHIYHEYNNYSISSAESSVAVVNVIKLVHSVLKYKIANIHLIFLASFWYGRNYTLIVLGAGVLIESYFTSTGFDLIKDVSFDYNIALTSNVTVFKEVPLYSYYYASHLYAFSRIFFTLFNQSSITIAENLTASWSFKNVKLYDDRIVSFPENLIANQNLDVVFSVSNGTWKRILWIGSHEPEQLIEVEVPYLMLFDPLTSIEFYKYEIEAIFVVLTALYWSSPILSKFKKNIQLPLKKKTN